jgi:hypothetical protein
MLDMTRPRGPSRGLGNIGALKDDLSTRGPETGGLLQGDVRRQRVDF